MSTYASSVTMPRDDPDMARPVVRVNFDNTRRVHPEWRLPEWDDSFFRVWPMSDYDIDGKWWRFGWEAESVSP